MPYFTETSTACETSHFATKKLKYTPTGVLTENTTFVGCSMSSVDVAVS